MAYYMLQVLETGTPDHDEGAGLKPSPIAWPAVLYEGRSPAQLQLCSDLTSMAPLPLGELDRRVLGDVDGAGLGVGKSTWSFAS